MVKAGKPISAVTYPGPLAVAHGWAYLPDMAETVVQLLERGDLADFETFHLQGHTLTGAEMVAALEAAAGRKLAVHALPWFAIRAMAPFNETFREMLEMRYLWEKPVLMDNAKLVARLGAEPHTPIVEALTAALAGMNALPQAVTKLAA